MPGTTEQVLHNSLLNTLQENNLWLNSEEIAAKRIDDVGWVENGSLDYTHHQETVTKIEAVITKVATQQRIQQHQYNLA